MTQRAALRKTLEFRFRKEMIAAGFDPVHTPMVNDGNIEWPIGEQMLSNLVQIALDAFEESNE